MTSQGAIQNQGKFLCSLVTGESNVVAVQVRASHGLKCLR
jgi:hypothetical protein